jgi:hypothetical protein
MEKRKLNMNQIASNLMKRIIFIIAIAAGICLSADGQTHINGGLGYFGENGVHPGAVLEFEYERYHTENFSLPLRADLGFHINPDYNAFTFDLHKGFRKYFASGLFLEQSIGVGVIAKSFKSHYWYHDQYGNSIPHGNSMVFGFMPSVTAGAGYDLSKEKEGLDLIWVRPKVYWDLGFRGLHLPYVALQIGFTHTFKTK